MLELKGMEVRRLIHSQENIPEEMTVEVLFASGLIEIELLGIRENQVKLDFTALKEPTIIRDKLEPE